MNTKFGVLPIAATEDDVVTDGAPASLNWMVTAVPGVLSSSVRKIPLQFVNDNDIKLRSMDQIEQANHPRLVPQPIRRCSR